MDNLRRKVFAVPAAFRAVGRLLWFISRSGDPYRLIYYTKQGDIERAFETLDMSDEEIRREIGEIRNDAEIVAEEVPEIREADPDDLIKR